MSLEKRKEVYRLALQYGVLILEDNPYGELRFSGEDVPTIKSMDTEGSSFTAEAFQSIIPWPAGGVCGSAQRDYCQTDGGQAVLRRTYHNPFSADLRPLFGGI